MPLVRRVETRVVLVAPRDENDKIANQITNAGYTYDALNRTTARGASSYTYNGDGVLVDGAPPALPRISRPR